MMRLFSFILLITLSTSLYARRSAAPKAGVWRFEIQYPNVSVPFLLELEPGKKGWHATLINGKERFEEVEVHASKDKWTVPLQTYQNYLEFNYLTPTKISGFFVKPNKTPAERIPVVGYPGTFRRFEQAGKKKADVELTGKWKMEITEADGKKTEAIALFDQSGNTLHASIMTVTGDYRFMDGYVSENQFETGIFDGVFNFVFKGKLEGKQLSGVIASKSSSSFTATRDSSATLPDPTKQTQVETVQFSFPDMNGKQVSLDQFKGKPVVIQIFGSWCPNCIDEVGFLAPWYEQNKKRGVEIIALSFERALSEKEAMSHLQKVVKKRAIPYPVLLAGTSGEDTPANKLPGIKNFISFPTTIFLDRNHVVRKVHAGFNGPGTGLYFEEFKSLFEATMNELLK